MTSYTAILPVPHGRPANDFGEIVLWAESVGIKPRFHQQRDERSEWRDVMELRLPDVSILQAFVAKFEVRT